MSEIIAIVGQTGTGKSTSLENLDPKETVIIGIINKPLPFKGWKKNYNEEYKNYLVSHDSGKIVQTLKWVNEKRPEVKQVIIDDFQYIMSTEFMERANEQGWQKFTDIGKHVWDVIHTAKSLREDLKVVFLTHDEFILENYEPKRKIKTIGKLLDEKVTLEGLFTIVLFTDIVKNKETKLLDYRFITQNDGTTTCKSPKGMFEKLTIPNDLAMVLSKVDEYYEG